MGGAIIVTADHGNCEVMVDPETGGPHTAHTLNPVPVILVGGPAGARLRDGRLADLAPTLLGADGAAAAAGDDRPEPDRGGMIRRAALLLGCALAAPAFAGAADPAAAIAAASARVAEAGVGARGGARRPAGPGGGARGGGRGLRGGAGGAPGRRRRGRAGASRR